MRILYICRVFTGFEVSLKNEVWQPTGAPTIYRVIEALDRSSQDVTFLMTCRGIGADYRTFWDETTDRDIRLKGLKQTIRVLAGECQFPAWLGRLRGQMTALRHLWRIWRTCRAVRPDLIYIDRSNVLAGAILTRVTQIPTVLRVMGVYPSMWDSLSGTSLTDRLARWAYRAPFSLVICTQDGSGGEHWLPRALGPDVPFRMLVNGFSNSSLTTALDPRFHEIPRDRVIVLFIGRFESIKGCTEFAEAMLLLHAEGSIPIHAVMVGTGRLHLDVKRRVNAAGADHMFTFIDRLKHAQIPAVHRLADIYVSLNKLGQLSNSNLEAMSMSMCMIIPQSQAERGVDVVTDQLIGIDAVVRLPWDNQVAVLADEVRTLANDPARRKELGERAHNVATKLIKPWNERIEEEFALISEHVGRNI